jgi:hypothetical protein
MACKETTMPDPNQWMSQYTQMTTELMQSAMKSYSPMLAAWSSWYQGMIPPQQREMFSSFLSSMPKGCCDIPETSCPPRCACTLTWQASVGELRRGRIEVRNTSKDTITYHLVSTPFKACEKTLDYKPLVTPSALTIAPGQSATATVEIAVGEQFHPGATYHSEILVQGKYERCVRLELQMRCDQDEICRFDHGDIPHRIRADDWYRHFQCSEPCFEPIVRTTQPTTPNNPTVPPGTTNPGTTTPAGGNPAGGNTGTVVVNRL